MRIAACVDLVPRKLGSLEQWIVFFVRTARERGHHLHLFWHPPVHPEIAEQLATMGVGWTPLDRVAAAPLEASSLFRRSYDVVYLNLIVPRSRVALAAYLAYPVTVLYFDQISGPVPGHGHRSFASRLLDPITFRRVAGVAGCSEYVTRRDRERFGLSEAVTTTIYNGSDPELFRPGERNDQAPPLLLAAAYLIPEKGIDVLVRACARIADLSWRLVIVGDGPELERLRQLGIESGIAERIEFAGLRDDVAELMRGAEIFIHPAIWEEAFGLTVTEAMASGCATIASRIGGIPEIIEEGVSGQLVRPGDPEALAQSLRSLLTDPERRQRMGKAARERVLQRFTLRDSALGQLDWIERRGASR